jgi:hypothetical protein
MRNAKCEINGNGKGKDLNRKGRQERKGRQRLVLWKKRLGLSLRSESTRRGGRSLRLTPLPFNLEP